MFFFFFCKLQKNWILTNFDNKNLLNPIGAKKMTRRNQKRFSPRSHNNNNEKQLVKMLDIKRLTHFRYDVKKILNSTEVDQKIWDPILASIVTKASRLSIKKANEYIKELEKEELLDKETTKALLWLLDKYKRWR